MFCIGIMAAIAIAFALSSALAKRGVVENSGIARMPVKTEIVTQRRRDSWDDQASAAQLPRRSNGNGPKNGRQVSHRNATDNRGVSYRQDAGQPVRGSIDQVRRGKRHASRWIATTYWFLVIVTGSLAIAVRVQWPPQFTLRTLFKVTTFLAAVLGMIAWLDHPWIGKWDSPILRRLLNIASIVCLVLCVALMGMWVRSYGGDEAVYGRISDKQDFQLASMQGRLSLLVMAGNPRPQFGRWPQTSLDDHKPHEGEPPFHYEYEVISPSNSRLSPIAKRQGSITGFGFSATYGRTAAWMVIPYWFPVLTIGSLAMAFQRRWPHGSRFAAC
jgi:hypothetical protein